MTQRPLYQYRRENGLCVNCGERAVPGKSRCTSCAQVECIKARIRYAALSPREKHMRYLRESEWRDRNPERVAAYKLRQPQYNKKYREAYKNGYEW